MCLYIYIYVFVNIYIYTYVYVCVYIYMCTYVVCIYTHVWGKILGTIILYTAFY